MTIPVLEGLTMETGEGKWRISCINEPKQAVTRIASIITSGLSG